MLRLPRLGTTQPLTSQFNMGEARGHHFISQCYLKRFTTNGSKNSKLWAFDFRTGKSFVTAPAGIGKQRDFNAIEGMSAGELEGRLAGFETEVSRALDKLEQLRTMDDHDAWVCILNLVTLFAVRNPRKREQMRGLQEAIMKRVLALTLATPERWESQVRQATAAGYIKPEGKVTYEQMKDFQQRGEYTIDVANAMHIHAELLAFEPVLLTMVHRKWTLCVAAPDAGTFLTSDHPVCLMRNDGAPSTLSRPLGYGLTNTTVVVPLTRHLAAMGMFEHGGGVVTVARKQVAEINGLVAHYAERQVYAADEWAPIKIRGDGPVVPVAEIERYVHPSRRRKRK
jgi:hypothetical protein